MNQWWPQDVRLKSLWILSLIVLFGSIYWHMLGMDHLLGWTLKATADKENITIEQFELGPFQFELEGQQYRIQESFDVSPFQQLPLWSFAALIIVWLGITGLLSYATFLKRYAFIFVAALYLLLVNQLYLDEIGLLGANSWKWASILLMAALLLPAYYLHAFREKTGFLNRWLIIFFSSVAVLLLFQYRDPAFHVYLSGHGTIAMALLTFLFIFLIAEEIIYLVLFFITQSKGGTNNEKHFLIFTAIYLAYLGLYWADKMNLVGGDWDYLNPFYLLFISTLIGFYTIRHKQSLLDSLTSRAIDIRWLFTVLLLGAYGFLLLGSVRGNDSIYDGISYLILYAHLGFGIMFLLYIIVNLMGPLIQGLMVYKVVYKDHNFPYITSRLAGFIFVVAFYFFADQAPLRRLQSGRLNFLGDYYEIKDPLLARSYYEESSVYGWGNHYASLKLAEYAKQREEAKEAIYRYTRALSRHPSPYAYVAAAQALEGINETTRAIALLKEGELQFPGQGELLNNLAVLQARSGAVAEALEVLNDADPTDRWNQAIEVNQLAFGKAPEEWDPEEWNWQARTNALALINQGLTPATMSFDTGVYWQPLSLPVITYLINSGWSTQRSMPDSIVHNVSMNLRNKELSKNLRHAHAYSLVASGYPNRGLMQWDELIRYVNSYEKGFYYRQLGVLQLRMNAPRLARASFEQAIAYGSEEALIGYSVASMELKDWSAAYDGWQQVTKRDSSYADLMVQLNQLQQTGNDGSFAWLYYNLPEEIEAYDQLAGFPTAQAQMLWDKLFESWSVRDKKNELAILTDRIFSTLDEVQKARYSIYQTALENPGSLDASRVAQNAFEEWQLLLMVDREDLAIEDRYHLLQEAIAVNPYHPQLIIAYATLATRMGLYDYAETATLKLLDLLSPDQYQQVERQLFDLRQEREDALDQWNQ